MSEPTRRQLLQAAAAAVVGKASNIIARSAERISPPSEYDRGRLYTHGEIEVYTNTLSAAPDDTLTLHVSTRARRFNLQIARIGLEETVVWSKDNLHGDFHPTPKNAWQNGCQWPVSARLEIPSTWKSGYYQIKAMTQVAGKSPTESLAFVVVRATRPTSRILIVLSTNTYGAYNSYGGASFYMKAHNGPSTGVSGSTGEHQVSFQRPWMPGFLRKPPSYDFAAELADYQNWDDRLVNQNSGLTAWSNYAGFHNWERPMVHWLELNGYALDYGISSDLDRYPELLGSYRLMLSVGHDEYWSWGMRDSVESFVAQGGNVCFFSGNVSMWQVRYEDDGCSMVCYKDEYQADPYLKLGTQHLTATAWSSHLIGRPETRMTGLSTFFGGYANFGGVRGAGGYLVYRPEHWIFKDSGLSYGDLLGQASAIVNFEVDGCPIRTVDGLPVPTDDYDGPPALEILGMIPASLPTSPPLSAWAKDVFSEANPKAVERVSANRNHAVMGLYKNNGTVFSAGTTDWTSGLKGQDPAVEQVTRNLLNRLSQ